MELNALTPIMIEIYYALTTDPVRERSIKSLAKKWGGEVTCRKDDNDRIFCLTAEFDSWEAANLACSKLTAAGSL